MMASRADAPLERRVSARARALVDHYVVENAPRWVNADLLRSQSALAILSAPEAERLECLYACLVAFTARQSHDARYSVVSGPVLAGVPHYGVNRVLGLIASRLLQRKLPLSQADLGMILDACALDVDLTPVRAAVSATERVLDGARPCPELLAAVRNLRMVLADKGRDATARKQVQRLARLAAAGGQTEHRLEAVDAWTAAMVAVLVAMDDAGARAWNALLEHCATASTSRPTAKWLNAADGPIEAIGRRRVASVLLDVLPAVGATGPGPVRVPNAYEPGGYYEGDVTLVAEAHSDCLRGLVWCVVRLDSEALVAAVGEAADRCFQKIKDYGPRAPKIGNACLYALANGGSGRGVAELTRLSTRVRHASSRRQVEHALDGASKRAGIDRDTLEELAVPTFGLDDVGRRCMQVGEYMVELRLTGVRGSELLWQEPSGKTRKSVPPPVREQAVEPVAVLKAAARELKKVLPAQARRVERMLVTQRRLPLSDWCERYRDHPLVGYVARRLLWVVEDDGARTVVACPEGVLRDVSSKRVDPSAAATVQLWHPITDTAATVREWRGWLEEANLTQPFKQAHREIYLLTDAERRTQSYSNRFAAHVLRQHAFDALCRERGWRYMLQGAWDSHNTPFLSLSDLGYRAELDVAPTAGDDAGQSVMGVYRYVATDQVRMYRDGEANGEPLDFVSVPPIVFSEVMRDVDLFVGVCSVGNDPHWTDSGPDGRFRDYWEGYAFAALAELGVAATTRREVLETLLPKLRIRERCSLDGRFLVVRGDLRSYRIHIGSGNVLMSPDDQYLCIVPGTARGQRVVLPFEGDGMLSIVLSKAFLLAADTKITDPDIVRQIEVR